MSGVIVSVAVKITATLPSRLRSQRALTVRLPLGLDAVAPLITFQALRPRKLLFVVKDATLPPGLAPGLTRKPPAVT